MATRSLDARWLRVLLAGVAVHVVGVAVSVAFIVAYSVATSGASVDSFAGLLSTWILPVLTLPAAVWAAYGARRPAPQGSPVGPRAARVGCRRPAAVCPERASGRPARRRHARRALLLAERPKGSGALRADHRLRPRGRPGRGPDPRAALAGFASSGPVPRAPARGRAGRG